MYYRIECELFLSLFRGPLAESAFLPIQRHGVRPQLNVVKRNRFDERRALPRLRVRVLLNDVRVKLLRVVGAVTAVGTNVIPTRAVLHLLVPDDVGSALASMIAFVALKIFQMEMHTVDVRDDL